MNNDTDRPAKGCRSCCANNQMVMQSCTGATRICLNTDCNSILKPFFSNITLNKSNDWDSLALGFYGVNTYQSETGGNNYPIVSGADEHIIGLCINVKIAWDIQAQFVFGWNNSNTIYAYRIKGDEWQPWIYNFMENR